MESVNQVYISIEIVEIFSYIEMDGIVRRYIKSINKTCYVK